MHLEYDSAHPLRCPFASIYHQMIKVRFVSVFSRNCGQNEINIKNGAAQFKQKQKKIVTVVIILTLTMIMMSL